MARVLTTALALAALLALAGCDRSDLVTERGRTVDARLAEYRIDPQRVSVPAGRVTFRVRNDGILAHNLKLRRGKREIGGSETIGPGETTTFTVRLRGGGYRMYCSVSRHEVLGQYGGLHAR